MLEYNLDISKDSSWILTTQNQTIMSMPFYLSEIGNFLAGEKYYTRRENRSGYYLIYTYSGCGIMELDSGSYELPTGSAMLINCDPPHYYHTCGESWHHAWMHLDGTGAGSFCTLLEQLPVTIAHPKEFLRRFTGIIPLASHIDIASAARISHTVSALLTEMVTSRLTAGAPRETGRHSGIEQALSYIEQNYSSPLCIDEITSTINMSKFHFVRLFRGQVGATPYNYLIHYRINEAKRLLCTTAASVGEIARQVGFGSESNFISQFRRITDTTPAQFRKSNLSYL